MNSLLLTTVVILSISGDTPPQTDHNTSVVPTQYCETMGEMFLREEALMLATKLPKGFDIKIGYRCHYLDDEQKSEAADPSA